MLWFSSDLGLLNTPLGLRWQRPCLRAQRAHSSPKGQPACWWAKAVYTEVARGREKKASRPGSAWPIKAPLIPFLLSILFPKRMPPSVCLLFYSLRAAIPTDWNTSDTPLEEIPEYTTEAVTRCRPQCPLGGMLCGESNVITRPYTRPPFPLILVFTCGLLVSRQTGYGAFDFEIGPVLQ